jgi:hypothetical protein
MVICCLLANIPSKLSNLYLLGQSSLEACKKNLPLAGFQAITKRGYRPRTISNREQNELLVHKVAVSECLLSVIDECSCLIIGGEPLLARFCFLLVEG